MRVRGTILGECGVRDVIVENGKVGAIVSAGRKKPDAGSRAAIIAPTLFDIQVNGIRGIDLQSPDLSIEDIRAITQELAAWGVSRWVPTLVTGPLERIERGCRVIAEALREPALARAIPGIHIEGPYISPIDGPRGAHAQQYVRNPSLREFDRLYRAAEGRVLYVTLAPELPGAISFIKALVRRGVVVSLGHHQASESEILRAVAAGASMATHLGNGLASQINRHHNPLWPQLADERLAASFIADLQHLPSAALKSLIRAKGADHTILTSDCIHAALLEPGQYDLSGLPIEVKPSGRVCLSGTDMLAGSSLLLLQGVVNAVLIGALSLDETFASATSVPERVLGLRQRAARIRVGAKADFLVFEMPPSLEEPRVEPQAVFIDGIRKR